MNNFILTCIFLLFWHGLTKNQRLSTQLQCPVQIQQHIPQKFALLTMTYKRQGQLDVFTSYLQHYATMKCEGFDSIYIVWNNQQTPESLGVYQNKDQWINKVVITKTPSNKINWKFAIPIQAQQEIFLALDDDQRTSCGQIMKIFNSWKTYAVGKIGPLYSFAERAQTYNYNMNSFQYLDPAAFGDRKTHYFSVALMGCGFVSRHLMDLYYADLQAIKKMREVVQKKQNCQDILMNFITGYFYPQLISKSMHIQFKNAAEKIGGLSFRRTHKTDRHQCLNQFSQILGYNPLRQVKFQDKQQELIQRMNFDCIIRIKKQYLQKLYKRKTLQQIFGQKQITSKTNNIEVKNNQQSQIIQSLKQNKIQKPFEINKIQSQKLYKQGSTSLTANQVKQVSSSYSTHKISNNVEPKEQQKQFLNSNLNIEKQYQGIKYKQKQKQSNKISQSIRDSNEEAVQIQESRGITGVLPLQIQILLISTFIILLIIMVVLQKNSNKKRQLDSNKKNFKNTRAAYKSKNPSKRVVALQNNAEDFNNQLQIQ